MELTVTFVGDYTHSLVRWNENQGLNDLAEARKQTGANITVEDLAEKRGKLCINPTLILTEAQAGQSGAFENANDITVYTSARALVDCVTWTWEKTYEGWQRTPHIDEEAIWQEWKKRGFPKTASAWEEVNPLAQWVREHGSEYCRGLLEYNFEWEYLAREEFATSFIDKGFPLEQADEEDFACDLTTVDTPTKTALDAYIKAVAWRTENGHSEDIVEINVIRASDEKDGALEMIDVTIHTPDNHEHGFVFYLR